MCSSPVHETERCGSVAAPPPGDAVRSFLQSEDHSIVQVCEKENVPFNAGGMEAIIFIADGDMRNALVSIIHCSSWQCLHFMSICPLELAAVHNERLRLRGQRKCFQGVRSATANAG